MFIRLFISVYLFLQVFSFSMARAADLEKFERGHFVIYCHNKALANKLSWKAEYYYKKIVGHFGMPEFRPWEGRNKCAVYIYKTKSDYMNATGAPEWSAGLAEGALLRFSSYEGASDLENATFPHELTHLVFHLFMNNKNMPLWLEEGMAQFEEENDRAAYKRKKFIKYSIKDGSYIPLVELFNMREVPTDKVGLFYAESASIVDHLITDNIRTSYGEFLTCLKNGESVNSALSKAYQWKYKNGVSDLEKRWKEFVNRKY